MKLFSTQILEWYDYPVVFLASDETGMQKFLCVFSKQNKDSVDYLAAPISEMDLAMLLNNFIDVRTLLLSKAAGLYECSLKDDGAEYFDARPVNEISYDFMPSQGVFIGTAPSSEKYSKQVNVYKYSKLYFSLNIAAKRNSVA